jgi:hypothetical protein
MPMSPLPPRVRCRQIDATDIDQIVDLLTSGFRTRSRDFWVRALQRLSEHPAPPGYPKYGYLLESDDALVGVMLLIFSSIVVDNNVKIRCSVSSWYVEPAFRIYAAMLSSQVTRHKPATYFNITPSDNTLPILKIQDYTRYCTGRFVAIPWLSTGAHGSLVKLVDSDTSPGDDLPLWEIELLLKHRRYGCTSVTCSSTDGRHPFVFLLGRKAGMIPFAYLAYCRQLDDFVRFAGPLGRFLAWRRCPLVVVDANGPIGGLIGWFSDGFPKYFKGPDRPRLGDIAYSERVMFGF